MRKKPSFFERLTGSVHVEDEDILEETEEIEKENKESWLTDGEGELAIDVHQEKDAVVIKTMVAGVDPSDLEINVSRDMITIHGKRENDSEVEDENYYHRELYWGAFSRTIMLPCEVESEEAEAKESHGLLIIRLPKIDKNKQTKLQVKSK